METALYHHGIKGQKWGVKNGPPYPLGASKHSISDRNNGRGQSLKKRQSSHPSIKAYSSDAEVIMMGAAFVTSLGSVLVKSLINDKVLENKGKKLVEQFEKENAFGNKYSRSIDSKDVNPLKDRMNCGACCMAEEIRIRGVSVAAKPVGGMTIKEVANYFKGASERSFDKLPSNCVSRTYNGKETQDNLSAVLAKKYPEGSRGCMFIPMWCGNHYITWEVKNGKGVFKNPQDTKFDLTKDFAAMVASGTPAADQVGIRSMRWDNLEVKNDIVGEVLYTDQNSLKQKFSPII